MKYLLLSSFLAFSLTAFSQEYYENDGHSAPGTIEDASTDTGSFPVKKKITTSEDVVTKKDEAPIDGTRRLGTDDMNTAPNIAPETRGDVIENTTLTGPFGQKPDEIEAQEEDALDYSTTPQKRTTKPLGPNKN